MARDAKPLEKRTKAELLDHIGRRLSKDELVSLARGVENGFRPYASGEALGWANPQGATQPGAPFVSSVSGGNAGNVAATPDPQPGQ